MIRRLLAPTPAPITIAEEVGSIFMGAMVDEDVGGALVREAMVVGEIGDGVVGLEVPAWALDEMTFGVSADELVGIAAERDVGRVSLESEDEDEVEGGSGRVLIVL